MFLLGSVSGAGISRAKSAGPGEACSSGAKCGVDHALSGKNTAFLGTPPVFSERQLDKKRESVRCLTLWCNARYAKSAGGCGAVADKEKEPWDPRWSGEVAHSPASQGSSLLQ